VPLSGRKAGLSDNGYQIEKPRIRRSLLRDDLVIVQFALSLVLLIRAGGLVVAFEFSRVMRALLFHIDASDPLDFAIAPAVLGLVGLIAIFPNRKATRIDPNATLRFE
jgi:hypothetical protein